MYFQSSEKLRLQPVQDHTFSESTAVVVVLGQLSLCLLHGGPFASNGAMLWFPYSQQLRK